MRKEKLISRTFDFTNAKCIYLDENNAVVEVPVTLSGDLTKEKVKKALNTPELSITGLTLAKVLSVEHFQMLGAMSENNFLYHATWLDSETRKPLPNQKEAKEKAGLSADIEENKSE